MKKYNALKNIYIRQATRKLLLFENALALQFISSKLIYIEFILIQSEVG